MSLADGFLYDLYIKSVSAAPSKKFKVMSHKFLIKKQSTHQVNTKAEKTKKGNNIPRYIYKTI